MRCFVCGISSHPIDSSDKKDSFYKCVRKKPQDKEKYYKKYEKAKATDEKAEDIKITFSTKSEKKKEPIIEPIEEIKDDLSDLDIDAI